MEEFNNLKMNETVFGIKQFKTKCLKEFPEILTAYSIDNMQQALLPEELRNSIWDQLQYYGETAVSNSRYDEITEGRNCYTIGPNDSPKLVVQKSNQILIDLTKTYFTIGDITFNITSSITDTSTPDPIFKLLFNLDLYINATIQTDTNEAIREIHHSICNNTVKLDVPSINLNYVGTRRWGNANLIRSISDSNEPYIKFITDPFLIFEKDTIILNISSIKKLSRITEADI